MKNRIQELRKAKNYNQAELGLKVGYKQGSVSDWENGRSDPPYDVIIRLADILGTSVDYLICATDTPPSMEEVTFSRALKMRFTDEDPQIKDTIDVMKALNAEGMERVLEYAEFLKSKAKYQKKPVPAAPSGDFTD